MLLANRGYDLFDEMFRDPFFRRPFGNSSVQLMKSDIREKDGNYLIDIELPGYKKEDIKADLKDGYLTISAQRHDENEENDENGRCLRKERYTGACNRSFYVGEGITEEDVKAAFKDGILHLEVPKEKEKVEEQPRLITID